MGNPTNRSRPWGLDKWGLGKDGISRNRLDFPGNLMTADKGVIKPCPQIYLQFSDTATPVPISTAHPAKTCWTEFPVITWNYPDLPGISWNCLDLPGISREALQWSSIHQGTRPRRHASIGNACICMEILPRRKVKQGLPIFTEAPLA